MRRDLVALADTGFGPVNMTLAGPVAGGCCFSYVNRGIFPQPTFATVKSSLGWQSDSASNHSHELEESAMRVLIADDSSILRERVWAMLAELTEDIQLVGEAGDGIEAVDSIRRLEPDAVILDISMPGKSGIEVLQEIKGDEKSPMVMILTNHPYSQYRNKCLEAGADFFYDKSNELCKVTRTLRQLIQNPQWDRGGNVCDGCSDASVVCSRPTL